MSSARSRVFADAPVGIYRAVVTRGGNPAREVSSVRGRGFLLFAAAVGLAVAGVRGEAGPGGPGRIAFVSTRDGPDQIYVMNGDGSHAVRLTAPPGEYGAPSFSADGRRIAFVAVYNNAPQIFLMNADGSQVTRLTNPPGQNGAPAFSPDGRRIAFISNREGGHTQVYVMDVDGSRAVRLTNYTEGSFNPTFSPDGRKIAFEANERPTTQIYAMDADGRHAVPLTAPPRPKHTPAFSPDGRRIAFVCQPESGGSVQICLMDADGSHVTLVTDWPEGQRIVTNANMSPHFSPDGRKIAFTSMRGGSEQIYLMNVDGSDVVRLTTPPGENFNPVFIP